MCKAVFFMRQNRFYVGVSLPKLNQDFKSMIYNLKNIGGNALQICLDDESLNSLNLDEIGRIIAYESIFLVGISKINLAKDFYLNKKEIDNFVLNMKSIVYMGGVGIIVHVGHNLSLSKSESLLNIKNAIEYILYNTDGGKVVFENGSKSQNDLGSSFEALSDVYEMFSESQKKRLVFCLDTCYLYKEGYDLSSRVQINLWKEKFNSLIGWHKVLCIHLNDARDNMDLKEDRHADLGYGLIGKKGLKEIVKLAKKTRKPLILETIGINSSYEEQIEWVRREEK